MKKLLTVFLISIALVVSGLTLTASAKDDVKKSNKVTAGDKKTDKKAKTKANPKEKKKEEKKVEKKTEKKEKTKNKSENKSEKKPEKKQIKESKHSKTADEKELGKDSKGRMIYEGPRGGQYYYTDKDTKVYLKKEDKK